MWDSFLLWLDEAKNFIEALTVIVTAAMAVTTFLLGKAINDREVKREAKNRVANNLRADINIHFNRSNMAKTGEVLANRILDSGYNPEEMLGVMKILKDAAGPNRVPEFQSTHPDPENRIEKIREAINKYKKAS